MSSKHQVSWAGVLLSLLFAAAAVVCILQWRRERDGVQRSLTLVTQAIHQVDRRLELSSQQLTALGAALHQHYVDLKELLSRLPQQLPRAESPALDPEENHVADESAVADPLQDLPPLPEGINPEEVVRSELDDLLKDVRVNPNQKALDRVGAAKINLLIAEARGKIETLDRQIHLALATGLERLKAEGRFIEYAKGESYQVEEGVLTAGEETETGGVRMFYLYPQEFAEVYDKRSEKAKLAQECVRKLVSVLEQ